MSVKSLVPNLHARKGRTQAALLLLLAWFATSWPIGAAVDWQEVSQAELPYLVADLCVLAPLSAVSLYGLVRSRPWARLLVLSVMGAFAYDAVNFLTFIAREELFGIPRVVSAALIPLVILAMAWLVRDEIRHLIIARPERSRAAEDGLTLGDVRAEVD